MKEKHIVSAQMPMDIQTAASIQMVGLSTSDRRRKKRVSGVELTQPPSLFLSEGSGRPIGLSGLQGRKEEIGVEGLIQYILCKIYHV